MTKLLQPKKLNSRHTQSKKLPPKELSQIVNQEIEKHPFILRKGNYETHNLYKKKPIHFRLGGYYSSLNKQYF
mgnify:CR=1 FL=1|jgi:hypothetical protein